MMKLPQNLRTLCMGVTTAIWFALTPAHAQADVRLIHITGCTANPGCSTSSNTFSPLGINILAPNERLCENHIIDFNARAVVNSLDNGEGEFQLTKTVKGVTTVLAETQFGGGRYPAFMRIPVMLHAVNTNVCKTAVRYGVRWRKSVGGVSTVLSSVSGAGTAGAILTVLRIRP